MVSLPEFVSSDSLFFYNVDGRENATHRILVDVEGDDVFDGVDDISTPWLSSACELNETSQKIRPIMRGYVPPLIGSFKRTIALQHFDDASD